MSTVIVTLRAPGIDGVFRISDEHLRELLEWLVERRVAPEEKP